MQRTVQSNRRRGFTLMELLVVLAILVLLMAMVAPRVLRFLGSSDISVATSQIGSLKKSLDLYAVDCRKYPTTEQGLQALLSPPAMGQSGGTQRGWNGPYIDGDIVPVDPWGMPYGYAFPPTRGRGPGPDIWSCGPDSMDGTEDDICSWHVSNTGNGEGMPGEEGMGEGELGGQLGPDGMPMDGGLDPMGGTDPMGGVPPMGRTDPMGGSGMGGVPPMGGADPMGGTGGMGGVPPMGGTGNMGGTGGMGGVPPMGGADPMGGGAPMGGATPMPGGTGQQPGNF